jgi:hypothetical protein
MLTVTYHCLRILLRDLDVDGRRIDLMMMNICCNKLKEFLKHIINSSASEVAIPCERLVIKTYK